jgi:hypothetical protein
VIVISHYQRIFSGYSIKNELRSDKLRYVYYSSNTVCCGYYYWNLIPSYGDEIYVAHVNKLSELIRCFAQNSLAIQP